MNTDRIKRILEAELANAEMSSELVDNRAKALDYFHNRARGDEVDGRSKVQSSDVAEAIEWILPDCIEAFIASDEVVAFDPVSQEDEKQAEQESDYINYVIRKENDAFAVFSEWFQDALLQKNGYVKVSRKENKQTKRQELTGLTAIDIAMLQAQGWELAEADEFITELGEVVYDVVMEQVEDRSYTHIECIAPEEMRIARDHSAVSLQECRFVAHEREIPRHELVSMGIEQSVVDSLPRSDAVDDEDDQARDWDEEQDTEGSEIDKAMELVTVSECYVRMSIDDGGDVRLWKCLYGGSKVLDIEECDMIPIAVITPRILSHNHDGLSIYDRLKSVQDQKTAIWRQILDNLYLHNIPQTYVNTRAGVTMADVVARRVGGVIRGERPMAEALSVIPTIPIGSDAFTMLDYLDRSRASKAGVAPEQQSQSNIVGNETAHGIERMMSAKEKLVGLIIRTFAETGMKQLVTLVRYFESKYQDAEKIVGLRGDYVRIAPNEWKDRYNTTIKVGLGTGDNLKQMAAMDKVFMLQEKVAAYGGMGALITAKNIHNALEDYGKFAKLPSFSSYFMDPESDEAKKYASAPKPPDPTQQMVEMQAKNDAARIEIDRQKLMNERMKIELEREKQQFDQQMAARELELKYLHGKQDAEVSALQAVMGGQHG